MKLIKDKFYKHKDIVRSSARSEDSFSSANAGAWVEAIKVLRDNPELRKRLKRNAYQAYQQEGFAPEKRVEKIISNFSTNKD